jgi:hypothetical protein
MAQSFYRPTPENTVEDYTDKNTYYHQASDTYFAMIQRGGRYFQRQYQIGFDGESTPAVEKAIDFVLGSGHHVRTYLVWQKYSCGTAVVFEQPAEAFSANDQSSTPTAALIVRGKQKEVALALVIAFVMVMRAELGQCPC